MIVAACSYNFDICPHFPLPPTPIMSETQVNRLTAIAHRANDISQSHKYTFEVVMTCGGCSSAVQRVLDKLDGKVPQCDQRTS